MKVYLVVNDENGDMEDCILGAYETLELANKAKRAEEKYNGDEYDVLEMEILNKVEGDPETDETLKIALAKLTKEQLYALRAAFDAGFL